MNKKTKISLWVTALILLGIVIVLFSIIIPNKNEPNRLSNIPPTAVWRGGVDEGFWIEIVNVQEGRVRLRIYNDYNGQLDLDADFKAIKNCNLPDRKFLLESINYFEFRKIVLLNGCELEAIYPAYGGAFWEIDIMN